MKDLKKLLQAKQDAVTDLYSNINWSSRDENSDKQIEARRAAIVEAAARRNKVDSVEDRLTRIESMLRSLLKKEQE